MLINLTVLQDELDKIVGKVETIDIEFMANGALQFRGAERWCVSDYATMLAVIMQQNVTGSGEAAVHRALAKHIVTRLMLQRKSLLQGEPCAEPVLV